MRFRENLLLGLGMAVAGCGSSGETSCTTCAGSGGRGGILIGAGGGVGGAPTAGGPATAGGPNAGRAGASGGAESATLVRLAAPKLVTDIAVKDGFVYYGDFDDDAGEDTTGHLAKVSTAGGTPTILARAQPAATASELAMLYPKAIVVHGSSVYWIESRLRLPPRLAKVSVDGGDIVEVWSDSTCSDVLPPLAIDGDNLYWMAGCAGTALLTVSATGGAPRVVASGSGNLWLQPGSAWTPDSNNRALTVGNGFAFWARVTGPVVSLPLAGGVMPTQIAHFFGVSGPSAIIFSRDRLFVARNDYKLQSRGAVLSLVPGETMTTIAENQNIETDSALAVDATTVYWGVNDSIRSAPRGGGAAATVVSSVANPRSFALDATHLYFTDDNGGVLRAPKHLK